MKFRHRASVIAMTITALIGATSVTSASPASAATYKFPPNKLSPMFTAQACNYRVSYGTFAGHPYAFLRVYRGCGGPVPWVRTRATVTSLWTEGMGEEPFKFHSTDSFDRTDSCTPKYGTYREVGGVVDNAIGFGVGAVVELPRGTVINTFHHQPKGRTTPTPKGDDC